MATVTVIIKSKTMWPFRKSRSPIATGFFTGFTDYHSHILPGVDDGVPTIDESLAILSLYARLGVKAVWLTPHIMEDIPNTTARLQQRFAELQTAWQGSVTLHLAAEYMLDNLFLERLATNDLLPLGNRGDHLLVETSCFNPPMDLFGILDNIKTKGFHPVLAHPERYAYMDETEYRKLKAMGVKFQLNVFSLNGMYGKMVRKKAEWMEKCGWYEMRGTDVHAIGVVERLL